MIVVVVFSEAKLGTVRCALRVYVVKALQSHKEAMNYLCSRYSYKGLYVTVLTKGRHGAGAFGPKVGSSLHSLIYPPGEPLCL